MAVVIPVLGIILSAVVSWCKPCTDACVEPVVAAIKRKCNYLCYFTTNRNDMETEAKTLEDETQKMMEKVERERQNAQDIVPDVETWLTDSNDFKDKVVVIRNNVENVKSGCMGLTARYSLSRDAVKITEAMKKHREKLTTFERIARPKPIVATVPIPLAATVPIPSASAATVPTPSAETVPIPSASAATVPTPSAETVPIPSASAATVPTPSAATVPIPSAEATHEFISRKEIEDQIMTHLKDKDMIGVHGMGGLGKTFMAHKIRNRALNEHVFDEVVLTVVSQQVDESEIQLQIAEQLGVKLEEQTLFVRANRIRERLNDSKRTLLIVDDVWECLKLVEIGIPCGSKGCKVLFTSRNSDVLKRMNVGNIFGMDILSEDEAWLLFKRNAGTCVDDMKLNPIARNVVKECKGLPIAIVTVGAAMKDEWDEGIWKDTENELKRGNPNNIPDFIEEVYKPLEVSYTKLASEEAKSLFLLCCLFPEDANISADSLIYFCMGLRIFENVKSMEEARNRMCKLIMTLKSRSLLLDSEDTNCVSVRMHDVVRDVCRFIAKQKGYIDGNECKWISSFETSDQLPMGMEFQNLRLLYLKWNSLKEDINITTNNLNTFVEGIRDLYVLSMETYGSWSPTPTPTLTPTKSLKNLRTLILKSCHSLDTISLVGDLVNLEILCCQDCKWIEELPVEIGRLKCLKLLDLTGCVSLQSIGRGIISSLVGLEELKMLGSFRAWEAEDKEDRKNAGLRELGSLTKLSWLEIEVRNLALAAENMRFSSKIERFQIYFPYGRKDTWENKVLDLEWVDGTCLGDWIKIQLLRDTQRLVLSGAGVNNVELAKIPDIIYASLFTNLSSLHINSCPRLDNLRQLSLAGNNCFPHLERLVIKDCEVMEEVFLWNEENKNNSEVQNQIITKIFPKLKEVHLEGLPRLTTFSRGIEKINFPLLVEMNITRCPKMTSMISTACVNGSNLNNSGGTSSVDDDEKVSFGFPKNITIVWVENENLLHSLKPSFKGLEKLRIEFLPSVSLFTSSIVGSLVCLKELYIDNCLEMVSVIQDDDEEREIVVSGSERTLEFPKLQTLELINLCKIETFCKPRCEFPSLTSVEIMQCSNMKNFTLESLIAPNLKALRTDLKHRLEVSSMRLKKFEFISPSSSLRHYKISESFFMGLDKLSITNYSGRVNLFSFSIVRNLINLRNLRIDCCPGIKQVIKYDNNEEPSLFPKLETLTLDRCYELVTFCEWKCDVELASLKMVDIRLCRKMANFTLGSLTTPVLADIIIDFNQNADATKGLNGLLQQEKKAREEAEEEKKSMDAMTKYWILSPSLDSET